jgi:hypothetical protein
MTKTVGHPTNGLMKEARSNQTDIYREMNNISRKFGPEVFRIVGQRYFKRIREGNALREEIAAREAELKRLQAKIIGAKP